MKIAFYTASHLLTSETSDTRYVHDGLARYFDVDVFTQPDASLASGADIIFCRFPKPADEDFLVSLTATTGKLIINDPTAQIRHGTKRNLERFAHLTAPTLITTDPHAIRAFAADHREIVFKPLDQSKGYGVTRVNVNVMSLTELDDLVATYVASHGEPMIQPFLECVQDVGDKRINVFRFDAISAVVTFPKGGSFICHESAGGSAYPAHLTVRDREIVDAVVPFLRKNGIWWAALDVIGSYLSEVNIATPSMVLRADQAHENTRGLDAIISHITFYAHQLAISEIPCS